MYSKVVGVKIFLQDCDSVSKSKATKTFEGKTVENSEEHLSLKDKV
jgi:type 1 fimbria pilin